MSLLAISPFLPILSIPCFSHCFAALRLLSLLDIKRKTIQHHLMSDTIYVSLSVRCTICFDVSSDVWSAHISFHQTFAPSPNNWLLNVWLQQRIHNWLLLAANSCQGAVFCWPNTRAIGAEYLNWPTINFYWNYWNNWPTTSYSLLEQICFGADERQMALSGVESIDTLPSVESRNIN